MRRDDVRGWGVVVPKMTFTLALHLTPQPSAPQHQSPITPTTIVPVSGRCFQPVYTHPVGSLTTASVLTRCGVGDGWGAVVALPGLDGMVLQLTSVTNPFKLAGPPQNPIGGSGASRAPGKPGRAP